MSKLLRTSFALLCLTVVLPTLGCGRETKVIEAPPAEAESTAMPGMTDEEYNKAMEAEARDTQ